MIDFPANDDLDAVITGATSNVRTATAIAPDYKSADQRWIENCSRCRGTGQTRWGVCFKCKGVAKKTFKTSPEDRAQNRQQAQEGSHRVRAAGDE